MATQRSMPPHSTEPRHAQFLKLIQQIDPSADPTSILLFRQVWKAHRLLIQAAEKQMESAGLSWHKFMLLMVLQGNETHGDGGGLQPSELSDLQGIPRNTMSELLAGLEADGLISRELHDSDRRKFVIRLTPQGRKTLKTKLGMRSRQITKCFAVFSAAERTTLLELLTRLTQNISEINEHPLNE